MTPTTDFFGAADKYIRKTLLDLRPKLLAAQGAIEHKLKDDATVVTEMDLMVENTLHDELKKLDAGIGFSGEETGVDYTQKTFWLVDPIDGTESFIRGLPFCTNMITLIDNGQPTMSVIYNFSLDEYYLAIKGKGATMNGHPIHVSSRPMNRAYVTINGMGNPETLDQIGGLQGRSKDFIRVNASGYEQTAVARGASDAALTPPNYNPWDIAPGALLIEEAGGRVANVGYNVRNP